ncbi:hypothetical protein [Mesorhizobium sp. M1348]|uniref:hypothetical protein n=1 Tax=unclassified Mesorhizobium TaxID=325217 RepID=UPI003335CBDF
MDDFFKQLGELVTIIVDGLTQPPGATGAIFGLVGLMIQLWVRGEWPTGRLNEDSPKVVDLPALILAVFAAVAVGIMAAAYFNLRTDHLVLDPTAVDPKRMSPATKLNLQNALTLVAFGYFAADLRPMMKKLIDLVKKVGAFFVTLPNKLTKS